MDERQDHGREFADHARVELELGEPARAIAGQLAELFARHGAPLVLKRDNGSNLAGEEVDELLDAHGVIALNSPPYYPAYNGAIEYAQRELKARVGQLTSQGKELDEALAESPPLLNAKSRPCLDDRSAAEVFYAGRDDFQRQFTLTKRKEIRDLIQDRSNVYMSAWKGEVIQPKEPCGAGSSNNGWRRTAS